MKKTFWWITSIVLVLTVVSSSYKTAVADQHSKSSVAKNIGITSVQERFSGLVAAVYQAAGLRNSGLNIDVFQKALTGFYNLKLAHKLPANSNVITVVDFNKPSREKRMWIIDIQKKILLLNTWVAHGQGSGNDLPNRFSNNDESHQSSLGFYITDDIYFGKHGRSLRLDGMDEGFNNKARERAIVLHAAPYVCQNTINQLGRLGRSFGCPAVSPDVIDNIIGTLKGKTVLFINGSDNGYTSKYLNRDMAAGFAMPTPVDSARARQPVISARM